MAYANLRDCGGVSRFHLGKKHGFHGFTTKNVGESSFTNVGPQDGRVGVFMISAEVSDHSIQLRCVSPQTRKKYNAILDGSLVGQCDVAMCLLVPADPANTLAHRLAVIRHSNDPAGHVGPPSPRVLSL